MNSNPCPKCHGSGIAPDQKDTGARMGELRIKKGMTLEQMSKALGVSASFLCQLEHGRRSWKQAIIDGYISASAACAPRSFNVRT